MVRAARKTGTFGPPISPLGKPTGLLGLDSPEPINHVADRIAGDTSASAARRTTETALRQAALPVVAIIDDLDRLAPEELLVVFKPVRLAGHLPNVYYPISTDEQTLLDVLQRTAPVGSNDPRAQAIREKLIQVPPDLPALRDRDTAAMTTRPRQRTAGLPSGIHAPDQDRFSEAYSHHLQHRPRTPRAIKRYFGHAGRGAQPAGRRSRHSDRHLPADQRAERLPDAGTPPHRTARHQHRPGPPPQLPTR
ncbi:KAP family NTPase [Streptomyces olivaceus]|nr:KAP family NTPase [Streptomyces olivaceus]